MTLCTAAPCRRAAGLDRWYRAWLRRIRRESGAAMVSRYRSDLRAVRDRATLDPDGLSVRLCRRIRSDLR